MKAALSTTAWPWRRKLLVGASLFLLLVCFGLFWSRKQQFHLLDGGALVLVDSTMGARSALYSGESWQVIAFNILKNDLPAHLRPKEFETDASRRGVMSVLFSKSLVLPEGKHLGGSGSRVTMGVIDASGKESLSTSSEIIREYGAQGKVTVESIVFDFPFPETRNLRLRLYETNALTGATVTSEIRFSPNP